MGFNLRIIFHSYLDKGPEGRIGLGEYGMEEGERSGRIAIGIQYNRSASSKKTH